MTGADVLAELAPFSLEIRDCTEKRRGKDSSKTHDFVTVNKSGKQLTVHALVAVFTKDGLDGTG